MRRFVPVLQKGMIPAAVVVATAIGVLLVARLPGKQNVPPPAETPAVNVDVLPIRPAGQVVDAFILPGIVEPNRVVRVAAEVPGRIEQICCREGQPRRKGDKIVHLNTDLLQAEFDQAKAQMEFDAREYDRIQEAAKRNAAGVMEVDLSRTKADASRAAFQAAKARLDRAVIVAPIDGVLNRVLVEAGEYVTPGQEVAEIVDIDVVHVVVQVPERDIYYVKGGQEAKVLVDSLEARTLTGQVEYLGELADEQTRTTRVEIDVDNRDRVLRSGQIVRAQLVRRVLTDAIMIPLLAVIPQENGRAVYVVENGTAQRRDVKLGMLQGKRVLVASGLKAGDRLIVAGHRFVAPDQPVRVVKVVEETP